MERDVRRGQGQWKGCYSFRRTQNDDNNTCQTHKTDGGLKMGHTYYYYVGLALEAKLTLLFS